MNMVLANGLSFAGRYFPAGTTIAPKGEPLGLGYFFAMAKWVDGRVYLISVRECDITTVETAVVDRNDTPIATDATVEYRTFNPDGAEVDGLRGRVDDIGSDGMVGVEWESDPGEVQWHCPSALLVVT